MVVIRKETREWWRDAYRDMENGANPTDIELRFNEAYDIGMIHEETYDNLLDLLDIYVDDDFVEDEPVGNPLSIDFGNEFAFDLDFSDDPTISS